jgi:hypothetical protein
MARNIRILLGLASLVLLAVCWLAFHDIAEPHTVRDWLTLVGSLLVWISTAMAFRTSAGKQPGAVGVRGA